MAFFEQLGAVGFLVVAVEEEDLEGKEVVGGKEVVVEVVLVGTVEVLLAQGVEGEVVVEV